MGPRKHLLALSTLAAGLLALQFTTAIVVSGEIPSLWTGVTEFAWLILGGVAAGVLVAVLVDWFDRSIRDTALQLMVSVATPYFAYLLGESLRSSGVLATVACGLYLGRTRSESFTTEARMDSRALWNTIDFVLNSLVFIVVGLQLPAVLDGYTVGVLVQTNFGGVLTIAGAPVGQELGQYYLRKELEQSGSAKDKADGSCMIVVATDAPLLAHQLKRLAHRVTLGLGRNGSISGNESGDIFIAFSTANSGAAAAEHVVDLKMLPNDSLDPVFRATVEATEEAIVNAMVAAQDMTGVDDHRVIALPHAALRAVLKKYGRLNP